MSWGPRYDTFLRVSMDLSQHENILPFNNDDQHVTGGGVGSSIFYFYTRAGHRASQAVAAVV